eukprot:13016518-Alexandrium_andersonii.AAC.1
MDHAPPRASMSVRKGISAAEGWLSTPFALRVCPEGFSDRARVLQQCSSCVWWDCSVEAAMAGPEERA